MAIYTIADLHLSIGGDKPMDVFPGWENYQQKLEHNLRKTLKEEDTLIIPGDISWGSTLEDSLADFKFIDSLPGKKIISKGNHDYFWTTMSKMKRFFSDNAIESISILHNNAYEVEGYAICGTRGWINDGSEKSDQKIIAREAIRLRLSIAEAKKLALPIICFLHYPPVFMQNKCKEIWEVIIEEKIDTCFYGHLHGESTSYAKQGLFEGVNLRLISADYLGFCPYKIR